MATIAKIVIEAALDTKGIYRGAAQTQRTVSNMMRRLQGDVARARLMDKFFPVGDARSSAGKAANAALVEIQDRFARNRTNLMKNMLGGKITSNEFHRQMTRIERQAAASVKRLDSVLKKSNFFGASPATQRRIRESIQATLGTMTDPKMGREFRRSISAASAIYDDATRRFNQDMMRIRERQFRETGFTKSMAAEQGAFAAKAFNDSLIRGIDDLKSRNLLTPQAHQHLVGQFKQAGLDAGAAGAIAASRQFQQRWRAVAYNMTSIGRDMSFFVSVPMAILSGLAIKVAHDFEFAMNKVQGYTQATVADMQPVIAMARKLGRETQFTSDEVGEAFVKLSKAGLNLTESTKIMGDMLKLAAAADLDMATAADISTSILQTYRIEVDDFNDAMNMLVKTFISAKVELSDLGTSFRYVGAIAEEAGFEFSETAAILAVLAKAGLRGSMAGTTLRGVIGRLQNPPRQARKALAELGVQIEDTNGEMLPFINILRQLQQAGGASRALEIFGLRAGPGMAVLISQGVDALAELEAKIRNHGNVADDISAKMMSGLRGAWKHMTSAAQEAAIAMGDGGLLTAITWLITKLTAAFQILSAMPDALKGVLVAVVALTIVVGPLAWAFGNLAKMILLADKANLKFIRGLLKNPAALITGIALMALTVIWLKRMKQQYDENSRALANLEMRLQEANEAETIMLQNRLLERKTALLKEQDEIMSRKRPLDRVQIGATLGFGRLGQIREALAQIEDAENLIQSRLDQLNLDVDIGADLEEMLRVAFEQLNGVDIDVSSGPFEELNDQISSVITRLEIARDRGLNMTVPLGAAQEAMSRLNNLVQQYGGLMKAPAELLEIQHRLWNAMGKEAGQIVERGDLIQRSLEAQINSRTANWQHSMNVAANHLRDLERMVDFSDGLTNFEHAVVGEIQRFQDLLHRIREKLEDAGIGGVMGPDTNPRPIPDDVRGAQEAWRAVTKRQVELAERSGALIQEWTNMQFVMEDFVTFMAEGVIGMLEKIPTPGDFLKGLVSSIGAGVNAAFGSLFQQLGQFNPAGIFKTMAGGVSEMTKALFAAAGPIGFFGSVFSQITNALRPSFEALEPVISTIGHILDTALKPVFEALVPVIMGFMPIIKAVMDIMAPILKALVPLFAAFIPLLEAMFPIWKMVAIAATYVGQVFGIVAGSLLKALGWFVRGIGWLIRGIGKMLDSIPFMSDFGLIDMGQNIINFGRALEESGESMFEMSKEMAKAREDIKLVELADSIDQVRKASDRASDSLTNVPSGYKLLNLRRWEAQDPRSAMANPMASSPSSTASAVEEHYHIENLTLDARDKSSSEIVDMMLRELKRRSMAKYGTPSRWAEV